jgi:hypothetical protein
MIWHFDDGNSINIWSDPWLLRGETRRPAITRNGYVLTKLVDLVNPIRNTWDFQLVQETLCDEDAQLMRGMQDQKTFSLSKRQMQLGFRYMIN